MLNLALTYQLDLAVFALLSLAAATVVLIWFGRSKQTSRLPIISCVLLVIFMAGGSVLAVRSGENARNSLRKMMEGFAPTYAHVFERMGHAKIRLDTPADDPLYLSLIQSEKEWLRVNPMVNDIYTFRMKADGTIVLCVDSETDYDRDGLYQGLRESRTRIGEEYPEADENLRRTFQGIPSFDGVPYTDRWGTWVSAYVPLHDAEGAVEGVLGVDYAADEWVKAILERRLSMLGYASILIIFLLAGTLAIMFVRREQEILRKAIKENIRLAQAVDAASDGVIMTDPNQPENPVIYANAMFLKITGYSAEEVIGRNCRYLQGPETDPEAIARVRKAIKERKPIKETLINYRKDGTKFWNGLRISPIFSKEGQLQYFLGFQADVTQRREAELALIAERDHTTSIIKGMPAIICGIGLDGRINFINPAGEAATGYSFQELFGKSWRNVFCKKGNYDQVDELLENMKKGDVKDFELTLTHKNGSERVISWNYILRTNLAGRLVEIVGFGTDVTERRRAEKELKKLESQLLQSQKMETVGTLAGGIAHDLNNQLTPLAGYIDLVMKETPVGDPSRELLVEAEQAARRCTEVVQRLMGFSRASTQKKNWFRAEPMLEELKNLLPKFLPKTIDVQVTYADGLWPIMGNDTELQTVFMNLSTNARDAMPQGGKFQVIAENKELGAQSIRAGFNPGPYVLFTVKDAGQGIPPALLQKIFEPFFTTKQKGQGTGLGLAMAFRIVHDHGGWLDVSSTVGQGTTFHLYLPADPGRDVAREGVSSNEALPRGSETVLFVDDEEPLRNIGRVFLERLGYKVILAQDGEEAVRVYGERRGEIGAVVMDMTMPKLTGKQAMKKMMQIDPKVRVLLASGYTSEGSTKELIQEGAVDFLPKPYTILPLAQALRRVIGKSPN